MSGKELPISFHKEGLNREYTASNKRLVSEFQLEFTSLYDSVSKVYNYYSLNTELIDINDIDSRWK